MSLPSSLNRVARRGLVTFAAIAALTATAGAASAMADVVATPSGHVSVSGGNAVIYSTLISGETEYIAGSFTNVTGTNGTQARSNIAAIDLPTGSVLGNTPSVNGNGIYSMQLSGTTLYLAGNIANINGTGRSGLAAFDVTTGAPTSFDPETQLGAGTGSVFATALGNGVLYAAGDFTGFGATPVNGIGAIRLSDNSVLPFNPGDNSQVFALDLVGTTLYAGGDFTVTDGQTRHGLAAYDTTSPGPHWVTSFDPDVTSTTAYNAEVDALADRNGVLYAGGTFDGIGAATRRNLGAMLESDGSVTSFNPVIGAAASQLPNGGPESDIANNPASVGFGPSGNVGVRALALDSAHLFVGGSFIGIGTAASQSNIAELNADGSVAAFDPNPNFAVNSLATDSRAALVAGGFFTTLGTGGSTVTTNSARFAALPANVTLPTITSTGSATPQVGDVLTCGLGTWVGTDNSYTYQWTSDGGTIVGAVAMTYTVATSDIGHKLACKVIATSTAPGTASASSLALTSAVPAPVTTPVVVGGGGNNTVAVTVPATVSDNGLIVIVTNVPKATGADTPNLPADVLCNHTCRSVARVYVSAKQALAIGLLGKGQAAHRVLIGNASILQTGTTKVKLTVKLSPNALKKIAGHKITLVINYIKTTDGVHTVFNTKNITVTLPKTK